DHEREDWMKARVPFLPCRGLASPNAACSGWLVSCLLVAGLAWGQGASYLTGYVQDSTGASVPNATVTIKNEATGVSTSLVTTDTGVYRTPSLDPGSYEIRVAAAGFQESVTKNVTLLVGQPRGLDITLQVGATNQVIEVSAGAPLLKTEDAGLGQNVQYE